MGSGSNSNLCESEIGIIPRVIQQLFDEIDRRRGSGEVYEVAVSYLEIYNEELKDSLHPETSSKAISVREDSKLSIAHPPCCLHAASVMPP